MNTRYYYTVLLLLFCYAVQAQTLRRGSYLGFTGGVGTAYISSQYNYGLPKMSVIPRTIYTAGAVAGVTLKGGHSIHSEVAFSWQSQQYQDIWEVEGLQVQVGKNLNLTYLKFPLMYRRIIGIPNGDMDIGDSKFFWGAGIEMAALYNAELDYTINGESDDFVFDIDFNPKVVNPPPNALDLFTIVDASVAGSFGWERFMSEHLVFQAEIKGAASVLDINPSKWRFTDDTGNYSPSRNMLLNFKCSFIFYVGRVERRDLY